jgi:hypothetical protein
MSRLRKANHHVARPALLYRKVRGDGVMHLDVMSGQMSSSSCSSDDELSRWLDEPVVTTPVDEGGVCAMQDVDHSPWIWPMTPVHTHPSVSLWMDNGDSSGGLSPASLAPSAFHIPHQKEPDGEIRKAHSLPVPRKSRATRAERRRYVSLVICV